MSVGAMADLKHVAWFYDGPMAGAEVRHLCDRPPYEFRCSFDHQADATYENDQDERRGDTWYHRYVLRRS